jgi:hypothetical protein
MLFTPKVQAALEAKQSHFKAYQNSLQEQQGLVADWLAILAQQSAASLAALLDERGVAWPGARPTSEFDRAPNLLLPFDSRWGNHVDARGWAMSVLKERPVAAVDGSQITPSKDFSIAVGAVQVGWFINFHEEGGRYIKDVEFEVLAPGELNQDADDSSEQSESTFPTQQINCLRFVRECERLCAIMEQYADAAERQRPLCIFDGSLIVSFAGQMTPAHAQPYVRAVRQLLECSERFKAPLVAFVDSSLSRDLVTMLEVMQNRPGGLRYTDGGLIRAAGLLNGWGDRTPFFFCARDDRLSRTGLGDFYGDVAFSYVQLGMGRPPARLEVPRWLVEAGGADDAVDLMRAECVVGMGYPYAIETADALAVISQQDRQRFYRLFEQFATRSGLTFTQARKAISKQIRR